MCIVKSQYFYFKGKKVFLIWGRMIQLLSLFCLTFGLSKCWSNFGSHEKPISQLLCSILLAFTFFSCEIYKVVESNNEICLTFFSFLCTKWIIIHIISWDDADWNVFGWIRSRSASMSQIQCQWKSMWYRHWRVWFW